MLRNKEAKKSYSKLHSLIKTAKFHRDLLSRHVLWHYLSIYDVICEDTASYFDGPETFFLFQYKEQTLQLITITFETSSILLDIQLDVRSSLPGPTPNMLSRNNQIFYISPSSIFVTCVRRKKKNSPKTNGYIHLKQTRTQKLVPFPLLLRTPLILGVLRERKLMEIMFVALLLSVVNQPETIA